MILSQRFIELNKIYKFLIKYKDKKKLYTWYIIKLQNFFLFDASIYSTYITYTHKHSLQISNLLTKRISSFCFLNK